MIFNLMLLFFLTLKLKIFPEIVSAFFWKYFPEKKRNLISFKVCDNNQIKMYLNGLISLLSFNC